MKANDLIPIVGQYPILYNSVSNFLKKKFDIQSAEMSLVCTYIVYKYIEVILSKSKVVCSWDLEDPDIIYKSEILKLFGMGDTHGEET